MACFALYNICIKLKEFDKVATVITIRFEECATVTFISRPSVALPLKANTFV
jgi:hypothetical protein